MNASVCEWSHLMCHVLDMFVVYFKHSGGRRNTASLGTWSENPLCMTSVFPRGERNWKLISFSIATLFMRISQRLGVDFRKFLEDKHCENISCLSIPWCAWWYKRVFVLSSGSRKQFHLKKVERKLWKKICWRFFWRIQQKLIKLFCLEKKLWKSKF